MHINKVDHGHEMPQQLLGGYDETYIRFAKERVIFMSELFTKDAAAQLSALLLYYDNQSHKDLIELYIHSNGGDAAGLSNIYDVMQMISAPIQTVCLGKCYSAGAVMLAAGTKGECYALKNSNIMIHGIQAGFPIPGHDIANSKNYYEFLEENNDNIMKMLAHHTGHSLKKVKEDCQRDVWMNAKQALEYGIIDHIL